MAGTQNLPTMKPYQHTHGANTMQNLALGFLISAIVVLMMASYTVILFGV
jgi:hypothetical protein